LKTSEFYLKCSIQAPVIFLHLGVLSINHICNKYGSTTSSKVASSSQIALASVFNQTGQEANLLNKVSKYFLSK
jgi:hypothetical protein